MRVARSFAALALAVSLAGCATAGPAEGPNGSTASSPAPAASPDTSASPSASDLTPAEIQQFVAQALSAPVDVSDPGPALDRTEQGMTDYMRRAAGVAELMGPNGGAILAGIDAAERKLIAAAVARLRAEAPAAGAGAPGVDVAQPPGPAIPARFANVVRPRPPRATIPDADVGGQSMFGALLVTMMAPQMLAGASLGASGEATLTLKETAADGSTLRFTIKPTLAGSRLTAEVTIDIAIAGTLAHTEQASGRVTVDACPDADGKVPLEVSLGGGFSILGGGMQYEVAATAIGHVDDTGNLASMDLALTGSLASQPLTGSNALGTAPMWVEISAAYPAGGGVTFSVPRQSFRLTPEFAGMAGGMVGTLGTLAATMAMHSARDAWTTGYCVAITVPEMDGTSKVDDPGVQAGTRTIDVPSTGVVVGSEKPFSAIVTHKFEAGQLHAPVTATLSSGAVSVTPSGTKVPSPAPFRYKAPDQPYKDAVVTLETRSRRGVATLVVDFRTLPPGWVYAPGSTMADGVKCVDLDGEWVVNIHSKTGGVSMTGKYVVTIDQTTRSGTYVYDLRQKAPGGSGTWHGTGRASVVLRPDGSVEMSFHGGTTKITATSSGGTSTTTQPGPDGPQFLWQRATTECR